MYMSIYPYIYIYIYIYKPSPARPARDAQDRGCRTPLRYPAGPSQSERKNRRRFSFGHSTATALRQITVGGTRESTGGNAHDGIHARSDSARPATVRQQQQRVQAVPCPFTPTQWNSPHGTVPGSRTQMRLMRGTSGARGRLRRQGSAQ